MSNPTVRLKSGGPEMDVVGIVGGVATCTWMNGEKQQSAEFAVAMLDSVPSEPVVPTPEQILAAGYAPEAIEAIVARQRELLGEWLLAHPPAVPPAETTVPTVTAIRGGSFVYANCPKCHARIAAPAGTTSLTCGCGQEITLATA